MPKFVLRFERMVPQFAELVVSADSLAGALSLAEDMEFEGEFTVDGHQTEEEDLDWKPRPGGWDIAFTGATRVTDPG